MTATLLKHVAVKIHCVKTTKQNHTGSQKIRGSSQLAASNYQHKCDTKTQKEKQRRAVQQINKCKIVNVSVHRLLKVLNQLSSL